jgi:glycosyltransferase involved in cell wall biosynthesis
MPLKKVLLISYFFPPLAGGGIQRTVKFAKYLSRFGWEPVILTVREGTHIAHDDSLLDDLPQGIRIYRAQGFEPEDISKLKVRIGRGKRILSDKKEPVNSATGASRSLKETLADFYLRLVPWFCIPDKKIGWLPDSYRMGKHIVARENIDVLYSTFSPVTSHLVGYLLKRKTQRPWVADFRDLWVSFPKRAFVTPIHRGIEQFLEKKVVHFADRIVANTDDSRQVFLRNYPQIDPKKFVTITNGFDAEDFAEGFLRDVQKNRFRITYAGNFYGGRNPQTFFAALSDVFQQRPELRGKLAVYLVGANDPSVVQLVEKYNLSGIVKIIPYQTHKRCLEILSGSDVLLLIDSPDFNVSIPGKTFEYLRTGKPILALLPEGATARLLRESGVDTIVHPGDVAGIKEILLDLYQRFKNGDLVGPTNFVEKIYDRRYLTSRLADIFEDVVGGNTQV